MAKDPLCGMEVFEEGAKYLLHFENETLYFCSEQCKKAYVCASTMKDPGRKQGVIERFLRKIAMANRENYGGKPPKCH